MTSRRIVALILSISVVTGCLDTRSQYWLSLPYYNDFSGTCDLASSDDAVWTTGCEDGQYRIVDKTSRLAIASVGLKDETSAITVQSHVGFIRGVGITTADDATNYGVSCLTGSSTTEPSGYLFVVSDDGFWAILRKTPQGWSALADNLDGDRLDPAAQAEVRGTCIAAHGGALLTLTVNGQTVHTVRDNHPFPSFRGFGVVVLTTQPNTATWFDDLRARMPTAEERAMREIAPPPTGPAVPHAPGTLFTDRFSRNHHVWQADANDAAHTAVRDGYYDIRVRGHSIEQAQAELLHGASAVIVEADVRERQPAREAGVACTTADGDGFLAVVSAATHRYLIWAQQGDEGTRIAAGHSTAVRARRANHLSVRCGAGGDEVALSVNGHVVADVSGDQTVDAYTSVRLSVESTRRTADAEFDNVVVREL